MLRHSAAAAAKSLQSCLTLRPHRRQPTRLPHPWDSPGKNTGVGCHFLLQCMKVKSESEVAQSCPTLRDPMDCSLSGSSIHGVFQARVLEWVAIVVSSSGTQPCSTLWGPMNCSLPGSSVHGIFQARLLEWVAISSSRGSSQPRNQTCVSCISCIGKYLPLAPPRKSSSWDYWTVFKASNFVSVLTLLICRLGSHVHG